MDLLIHRIGVGAVVDITPSLVGIMMEPTIIKSFPKIPVILFYSSMWSGDIRTKVLHHTRNRIGGRMFNKSIGKVISEANELEYGQDCLEMHIGTVQPGECALVIDDLVANGGTLSAAIKLLECVGAEVVECACVIGLPEVKGQCRLNGKPLYILVEPWEIDNFYRGRPPFVLCYHIKLQ
ncbi:hypothetical protein UlMin_007281 [Ulmus minor]